MISDILRILLFYFIALGATNKWIGPGKWQVTKVMECDNPEKYPYKIDVVTKKVNRTHDALDARCDVPIVIDDTVGFIMDICKHVDGGCKPYRIVTYKSIKEVCKKWLKETTEIVLGLAGVDPPDFPIQPGRYELKNYAYNCDELPKIATYGNFEAKIIFVKDAADVACFKILYEFKKVETEEV